MATTAVHTGNTAVNNKNARQRPPTHYEVLQVLPEADVTTIKAAYHKAALLYHPDKRRRSASTLPDADNDNDDADDSQQFQRLQVAWECLRNAEKRQVYDEELWLLSKQQSARQAGAIPLERSDCREEYVDSLGDYTLMYTCRCGMDVDTAEVAAEDDEDDDNDDDVLPADKDLITCSGCSLVYDTNPLWREDDEQEG
jgi:diphthamide biosynthesis protein 4